MIILVTGACGMIGSALVCGLLDAGHFVIGVDRVEKHVQQKNYRHLSVDLEDKEALRRIIDENHVDRLIHLAALAHKEGKKDFSWDQYERVNVDGSKNVFGAAGERPVLFISTVDVYGFYDGEEPVNANTPVKPVTNYGKSKVLAEAECQKLSHYTIFRFSPVYTDTVKRDIQKRYYLKYPSMAYQIGKGTGYEILNIKRAVAVMVDWCATEPKNDIRIIKDDLLMWTPDCIKAEKAEKKAKIVIRLPRWLVKCGYRVLKGIFGENPKTYLLNKVVFPLRSA